MNALSSHRRPAETVRQIAELALGDAVEITLLIALIERQNTGEINGQLNKDGAGQGGCCVSQRPNSSTGYFDRASLRNTKTW
jgi:hypothetical protein